MKEEYREDIESIARILKNSKHAVFFGGAGVSTESGIPDFRGEKGLYKGGESKEYYLSHGCLFGEPERFYDFYRKNMLYPDAKPNAAHFALAELEQMGILKAVLTQNIDGLHSGAGSKNVLELHGTENSYTCCGCKKKFGRDIIYETEGVPRCTFCGEMIRPDVTLYGEPLDGACFKEAEYHIRKADVLIAAGSSLTVQPAASLVYDFHGTTLIIINYSRTPYDRYADFLISDSCGEVLSEIVEMIKTI